MTTPAQPLPKRMYFDVRGYFAFPLTPDDDGLEELDVWRALADHVERAKAGHFDTIPALLDVYDGDDDWVRRGAYVKIMGDAGSDALAERVHRLLLDGLPADYSWDFAELLFYWGRLDVVPTLIDGWRGSYDAQDAIYLPPRLSLMLEETPDALLEYPSEDDSAKEADAYRELVLERHAELCEQLGPQAFVFRGRELDVEWIIRCALADLGEGGLVPEMRQKIEAMTGVDCSSFYRDQVPQPLAAAVVLEDMLADPDLARFVRGRRYFFGRPVPSGEGPPMLG